MSKGSKFDCLFCNERFVRNVNFQKYCCVSHQMKYEYSKGLRTQKNENHTQWKGDKAGYQAIHAWIRKNKIKPATCESCAKKTDYLDIANISGLYKRDVDDFEYLCRKCHMDSDGRNDALRKRNNGKN